MIAIMRVSDGQVRRIRFLTAFFLTGALATGFFTAGFWDVFFFALAVADAAGFGGAFLVKAVVFVFPADPSEAAAFRKGASSTPGS
jgi:hypothetical protein